MPFTVTDIMYGGVVPMAVTGVVLAVFRLILPRDLGDRYSATVAILSGYLTGYYLLALAPWTATSHWHWLVYAVIGAALVGPVAAASGVHWLEKPILYFVAAMAGGWVLVPSWEALEPSRTLHLVVFVAYIVLLAVAVEPLARRSTGPLLPGVMWFSMSAAAAVLAMAGSLRFTQLAGIGAAAFFGCMLVACLRRKEPLMIGAASLFAMLVVGSLLIGRVNSFSEVKLISYVLVPLTPVMLWLGEIPALKKLGGLKYYAVVLPLAVAPAAVAVVLAVIAGFSY